jgi:hypothetical protein
MFSIQTVLHKQCPHRVLASHFYKRFNPDATFRAKNHLIVSDRVNQREGIMFAKKLIPVTTIFEQ